MKRPKKPARNIDPHQIFEHATKFLSVDNILRQLPGTNPAVLGHPSMVLAAFGCELFLKCLLTLEGKPFKDTHSLDVLFRQIDHKHKRRIEEIWDQTSRLKLARLAAIEKNIHLDLPNAIVACRDAFLFLRYSYEDPSRAKFWLGELPGILREVILEIKPDWKQPEVSYDFRLPTLPTILNH